MNESKTCDRSPWYTINPARRDGKIIFQFKTETCFDYWLNLTNRDTCQMPKNSLHLTKNFLFSSCLIAVIFPNQLVTHQSRISLWVAFFFSTIEPNNKGFWWGNIAQWTKKFSLPIMKRFQFKRWVKRATVITTFHRPFLAAGMGKCNKNVNRVNTSALWQMSCALWEM